MKLFNWHFLHHSWYETTREVQEMKFYEESMCGDCGGNKQPKREHFLIFILDRCSICGQYRGKSSIAHSR